jgi:hypothetical protein
MKIRHWNPDEGDARQGDVYLFRVPDDLAISMAHEIKPRDGRLVLLEGEITGHHHAIGLRLPEPVAFRDDAIARNLSAESGIGTARLYRDAAAARKLVHRGELTRDDLCIGFLIVEGAAVALKHEEHDAIHIPAGRYYVGRQIENAGTEERIVRD